MTRWVVVAILLTLLGLRWGLILSLPRTVEVSCTYRYERQYAEPVMWPCEEGR